MSLDRFLQAQATTYAAALAELKAGRKTGHWIWWVFPQAPRAGTSVTSRTYALADAEVLPYWQHPVLGARYRECLSVVQRQLCDEGVAPLTLMGSEVDVLKLRSSVGLFREHVQGVDASFATQFAEILARLP
jgi:uncharacterized protein (DUF1810 family)